MSPSQFDEFRPPEPPRKRRFGRVQDADGERKRPRRSADAGASEGRREMLMVPDVEFERFEPPRQSGQTGQTGQAGHSGRHGQTGHAEEVDPAEPGLGAARGVAAQGIEVELELAGHRGDGWRTCG